MSGSDRRRRPRTPSTLVRTASLVAIALGVVLLLWAGITLLGRTGQGSVRGLVTGVEAHDIGHAQLLTVRSGDGNQWRFRVDPAVDMTPGHLREHMTLGQPVTVVYRREGDGFWAVRVTD